MPKTNKPETRQTFEQARRGCTLVKSFIHGFTLIIAFPRKSTVNGGHEGITRKIMSVLEESLVRPSR